jgi:Uma2 family endonuclease
MDLAQLGTDRYHSREEFRRWCEAQTKGRYERVDGWIVAMAPERGAHLRVKGAIYRALDRAVAIAGLARHCPMARRWKAATVTTNRTPW